MEDSFTMQCSRCGVPIQQGMTFCPNCGTPYASGQIAPGAASMPSTQYEPTVAAPPFYDPNVASQSYNSGSSGQAFSSPANAAPAQPGYNDYNRSPANPYTPEVPSSYSPQS